MTDSIASRARALGELWENYQRAVLVLDGAEQGDQNLAAIARRALGATIADRLEISPRQRVDLLPRIARQKNTRRGRPPKPAKTRCVTCPHCSGTFEVA